ncbi:hypothetical protein P5673_021452 [Acropora cervicornis]|uniref:Uncharacterized protein n=1 Tax=Acropora cervicornis TaxID=6130 RepID=A0AAD9Q8E2_ACRCE|nr:hypothetical protein P5673_021452 [Acropora cervicornis]
MTVPIMSEESTNDEKDAYTSVPIVVLTVHRAQEEAKEQNAHGNLEAEDVLPLPASKYRYSKWHELEDMDVKGNMLRSPRVRRNPRGFKVENIRKVDEEERLEYRDSDDEEFRVALPLKRNKPKRAVNLSYQDLGHPFQKKEFQRVLRRLIRCEQIQLIENSLTDLSTVLLPRCTHLYLQRNFITDLKKLPKAPLLVHLSLQENNIQSLNGLEVLRKTGVQSLVLKGNPVALDPNYRQQVFRILPGLQILDGIPLLDSDLQDGVANAKSCVIS